MHYGTTVASETFLVFNEGLLQRKVKGCVMELHNFRGSNTKNGERVITQQLIANYQNVESMETLIQNPGLQFLAQNIFAYFDHANLLKCRKVTQSWKNYIDNDSFLWKNLCKMKVSKTDSDQKLKAILKFISDYMTGQENDLNKEKAAFSMSAIHLACQIGDLEIVKFLFDLGADMNRANQASVTWPTPLHLACMNGKLNIVKFFVTFSEDRNINLNATDSFGKTPFHIACDYQKMDIVKYFLGIYEQKNLICTTDIGERSPFHTACMYGNLDLVTLLLDHAKMLQIDVLGKDIYGKTPLQLAQDMSNLLVVYYLITNVPEYFIDFSPERNGKPNMKNNNHFCRSYGDNDKHDPKNRGLLH